MSSKHENYEVLNLIGYGLAKFDNLFVREFNFSTKTDFYNFCIQIGVANSSGVVKNRMDLFDPFFENSRKGWWQKGDVYIHRKLLIDSLFGNANVKEYANIVKLYFRNTFNDITYTPSLSPITNSKFKKLQETGLEAELYFMNNYKEIDIFESSTIEDARLFGDGYDFQITTEKNCFLAEVKGIRAKRGKFRLTEKEYLKAQEYQENYIVTIVKNLDNMPSFLVIDDPLKNLIFRENIINSMRKEYYLEKDIC